MRGALISRQGRYASFPAVVSDAPDSGCHRNPRPGDRPGSWFTTSTLAVLPPHGLCDDHSNTTHVLVFCLVTSSSYHESIVHLLYNISSHHIHTVSFFLPPHGPGHWPPLVFSCFFPGATLLPHPSMPPAKGGRARGHGGRVGPRRGHKPPPLLSCPCSVFPDVVACVVLVSSFLLCFHWLSQSWFILSKVC